MKMLSKWLMLVVLLGLFLTGCGTSTDSDEKTNGSNVLEVEDEGKQSEDEQSSNDEQQVDESNQENENSNNEINSNENDVRADSQEIEYQVNGETKKETALLQVSDNQYYSMYVLPNFELTPEEPNKDIVFLSDNGDIFMRIELLPTDADWNFLTENTKAQLEAVNSNIQTLEVPNDDFFKNANVMEATSDNDVVTVYLVKHDTQPLKLTIFSQKDMDYRDAFLKMGKTIVKSN